MACIFYVKDLRLLLVKAFEGIVSQDYVQLYHMSLKKILLKKLFLVPDLTSQRCHLVNRILQCSRLKHNTFLFAIYMHDISCIQHTDIK